MKISKEQYLKLPNEYKKYFAEIERGGDDFKGVTRKNVHPT